MGKYRSKNSFLVCYPDSVDFPFNEKFIAWMDSTWVTEKLGSMKIVIPKQ